MLKQVYFALWWQSVAALKSIMDIAHPLLKYRINFPSKPLSCNTTAACSALAKYAVKIMLYNLMMAYSGNCASALLQALLAITAAAMAGYNCFVVIFSNVQDVLEIFVACHMQRAGVQQWSVWVDPPWATRALNTDCCCWGKRL